MAESTERRDPLVDHLEGLAEREDRATLALLRRTLQQEHALDGLSVVLPFVTRDARWRDRSEDDALLVSALFALHPESGSTTLPGALRRRCSDERQRRTAIPRAAGRQPGRSSASPATRRLPRGGSRHRHRLA